MVNLLALDTSDDACSLALSFGGRRWVDHQVVPRGINRVLLAGVEGLLAQAGVRLGDLDGIAFGAGPGSFTGLRIACGVVQGLAFGAGLGVLPVSTLEVLALGAARRTGARRSLVAVDARMNEIYWGAYRIDSDEIFSVHPPWVGSPAGVPVVDAEDDWFGVGSGWRNPAPIEGALGFPVAHTDPDALPEAVDLLELAQRRLTQGRAHWLDPEAAQPVYLRDQIAWRKRHERTQG